MLQKLFFALIVFLMGVAFIVFSSSTQRLVCNQQGACDKYEIIPFVNYVVSKTTANIGNLTIRNYEAICLDINPISISGPRSRINKKWYGLYIAYVKDREHFIKTNYNDYKINMKDYLHKYKDNASCTIDAARLNNITLKPDFKFTFTKSFSDYIFLIVGIVLALLGLAIPFSNNLRVMTEAEALQDPEKQNEQAKAAVEDFVNKHGNTIKKMQSGLQNNAKKVDNIMRILRMFGIKF